MDWRKLTQDIEALEQSSTEERAARLGALTTDDAAGAFITGYFERRRRQQSFMQTSSDAEDSDALERLEHGERIGVWRVERFIAAGGMGQVYEAMRADGLYDQRVALKVLSAGNADWLERFAAERQRLATLDHPGISRIIDGGTGTNDRPYMAIEYVEGVPIDVFIDRHGSARRDVLILMQHLCAAVTHAHGKLILHRDLKPSNVLVDASGQVRLIDFGVSSLIEDDRWGGQGPMTLAYAAPEQLRGELPAVATDIFSLGVVLHRLLVGREPERQADGGVAVDTTAVADADLVAILARATATHPGDRYVSADALADDLAAVLNRHPVAARNGGRLYVLGKAIRRNTAAYVLATGLFIALSLGLVGSLLLTQRATEARDRAQFFLTEARSTAAIEATYRDILDRVFSTEADSERIKAVMLARAAEAYESRSKDPAQAAQIALVVGTHFSNAYDIETARQVLEPWIEAGYGTPEHIRTGKMWLADVYSNRGDFDKALALLRSLEPSFDDPNRYLSGEHLQFAFELAYSTEDPGDEAKAMRLMSEAIATDSGNDPNRLLTVLHFQQYLQKQSGDFAAAYETLKQAAALYEDNPLLDHSGWGTIQIYLANYEFYLQRDFAKAEAIVEQVISWGEENGSPDDQAFRFKAELLARRGEFEQARTFMDKAFETEMQYFGTAEFSLYGRIELLAGMGAFDEAQALVTSVVEAAEAADPEPAYHTRLALAAAYLALQRDGAAAASEVLVRYGFTRERARIDPARMYRLEVLEAEGVIAPDA
ncbi:MAG: serine/threonine-protein kinase [Pseudomonadota bacterium]